jgi:redox-sensitive bicupin YhaK (pirin superfamily)
MLEAYPSHHTNLGALDIRRALPVRQRRMVGPWCFVDRYGPLSFVDGKPMDVAPHPHIGIQTVSWLLDGEVLHQDSLGFEATVRPHGVNVMTAGSGIAHAEQTPEANRGRLDGVQLWVTLPDADRHVGPSFEHVVEVPRLELRGGAAQVFIGALDDAASPARHFSEIVGADVDVRDVVTLPLAREFEHALLLLAGDCEADGEPIAADTLYYLAPGRDEISARTRASARLLLLGGVPFPEKVLMWWNFVARDAGEMARARDEWESGRFGAVRGYRGERIAAPPLHYIAPPNPAS